METISFSCVFTPSSTVPLQRLGDFTALPVTQRVCFSLQNDIKEANGDIWVKVSDIQCHEAQKLVRVNYFGGS